MSFPDSLNDRNPDKKDCSDNEIPDYLAGDRFMATLLQAEALATAFEIGLVDCLISRGPAASDALAERLTATPKGMVFLLDILTESGVVVRSEGKYMLSREFMAVLPYRELMELKLALANLAARDILGGFTDLVMRPEQFMRGSSFHRLFSYDRCFGNDESDRHVTSRWMRITTLLTRYESAACMAHHDFSRYRRILDVGGNSGEFALRLCRCYPDMRAVVFDLPLVCELGRAHVDGTPERDRISFMKGDVRTDELPTGHDLIIFKSMLHDWPDEAALRFIHKAARSLLPGGRILIFEREKIAGVKQPFPFSILPFLIFFHSYRPAETYVGFLEQAGFVDIDILSVNLDLPFVLITGQLP